MVCRPFLSGVLTALLGITGAAAQELMRPDRESVLRFQRDLDSAVPFAANRQAAPDPPSVDLLPSLDYVAAERSQGLCSDCWVWAGTALLEMALSRQYGIRQRLSIQFLHAGWQPQSPCCPADFADFVRWYDAKKMLVPWSNPNAQFQDNRRSCEDGPDRGPSSPIGLLPHYRISRVEARVIPTFHVGRAQAIANIKAALRMGKAVDFSIVWPRSRAAWTSTRPGPPRGKARSGCPGTRWTRPAPWTRPSTTTWSSSATTIAIRIPRSTTGTS